MTHSRGGLLGRELIEQQTHFASAARKIRVHKAIFVAAPNLGTILTDGDHGVDLLDRYTNLLTDLPDDAFTLTMEGVLALVKILALPNSKFLCGRHIEHGGEGCTEAVIRHRLVIRSA
jgi:hypothetical protein